MGEYETNTTNIYDTFDEMDLFSRDYSRLYDQVTFPSNYHRSFWSNYYSHYWQPSLDILPGFYQYYDPLLPKSEASLNIKSRSRYFFSALSLYNSHPVITM